MNLVRICSGRHAPLSPWSMKGRLLEMAVRMTGDGAERDGTLLSETSRLIDGIRRAASAAQLGRFEAGGLARVMSYRASVEQDGPFVRFHVTRADPALLELVAQNAAAFEVLEANCAGLQHHWRSDLVRALGAKAPLVGRLSVLTEGREIVLEHLMLPVAEGPVTEIRGWFTFGPQEGGRRDAIDRDRIQIIRRSRRVRPARLPSRICGPPKGPGALGRLLGAVRLRRTSRP